MPNFILLSRFEGDTRKDAANLPGRLEAFAGALAEDGITVVDQWLTLGHYEHVAVVEAPDSGKIVATLGKAASIIETHTDVLAGFTLGDTKALLTA
ncbi:GYD domain-containing protein [Patulibacter sp. NPDC049589]|uniref:GYD domain-containing protein n=1 Tax=Patulibacter sp. NPDC049589 TaxID=3154731 RepID=UPI00341CAEF0